MAGRYFDEDRPIKRMVYDSAGQQLGLYPIKFDGDEPYISCGPMQISLMRLKNGNKKFALRNDEDKKHL
ncbi:MAG: hypothetical protein HY514_00190 [Candidatus Aenigmarchaeota archaeon]|nr:hypothetical protein [Candidatus Aenigmarchaeota archaeon]